MAGRDTAATRGAVSPRGGGDARGWWVLAALLAAAAPVAGTQIWVVGGEDYGWAESGALEAIDTATEPGWIQPIRTTPSENLATGSAGRTTRAYSLQPSIQSLGGLEYMVDGDTTTAFEMTLEATVGSSVILDLGAVFPLSSVRFYPRQDELHKERFLRAFQVYVTDRSLSPQGQILWQMAAANHENGQSVVRVPIRNRYVRDVRIQAFTNLQWEIAEFEAYGQGFAPFATYTSDAIDLGGAANFGRLTWAVERDPTADIVVVTRSGTDASPYTYYRLERPEEGVVDTVEVSRQTYESVAESDRYREFDTEHWSFWSAPYASEGDVPIVSPAPRRYLQFQIRFESGVFTDRARVDSMAIEYSTPPVAREVVGEVSPGVVSAGEATTFTYAVTPAMEPGDTGFDALTVATPMAAAVRDLRIDGVSVDFEAEVGDGEFTVRFPLVEEDGARLEVTFDCQVLVFGTVFSGTVFDSRTGELPQEVRAGDASPMLSSNRLSVGIAELGADILSAIEVSPDPFSPNGDGVNDTAEFRYHLKKLLLPGRVAVSVLDLAGTRLWQRSLDQASGVYAVEWDGRDRGGETVAPGIYLYRVEVETASGRESRAGALRVVY